MIRLGKILVILVLHYGAFSQNKDSLVIKDTAGRIVAETPVDTLQPEAPKKHSPRRAAIQSAIIPGWGQVYNRKYWKIPIVYAAIGIPLYLFFDNKAWYIRTRDAARMIVNNDTLDYRNRVHEQLHIFFSNPNNLGALIRYRNQLRRDMDYSILFVLLFWGLNIIDATVDAHLKEFDVSEDLSIKIKPTVLPGNAPGMTVVLSWGRK